MAMHCVICFAYPCQCAVHMAFSSRKINPDLVLEPKPEKPSQPSGGEVINLAQERFKRDNNPNNHDPLSALRQGLVLFEEVQGETITHAIVILSVIRDDGVIGTKMVNAGQNNYHGQMGMIAEAQALLREAE